jgi:hypothetical protein
MPSCHTSKLDVRSLHLTVNHDCEMVFRWIDEIKSTSEKGTRRTLTDSPVGGGELPSRSGGFVAVVDDWVDSRCRTESGVIVPPRPMANSHEHRMVRNRTGIIDVNLFLGFGVCLGSSLAKFVSEIFLGFVAQRRGKTQVNPEVTISGRKTTWAYVFQLRVPGTSHESRSRAYATYQCGRYILVPSCFQDHASITA